MVDGRDRYQGRVPRELDGERLERVLDELLFDATRSQIQRLVRRGAVRVDGHRVRRTGERIPTGARVQVDFEAAQARREREPKRQPAFRARDLVVVYEDEHLAVVDKPAGLLTHGKDPAAGRSGGSGGLAGGLAGGRVAEGRRGGGRERGPGCSATPRGRARSEPDLAALAAERFGPLPILMGAERPGIVHRLDRWTSGLMVIARTDAAMSGLREAFRARAVHKAYLAVVHGDPRFDETVLDQDLVDGRDQRRGWRPRGQGGPHAQEAETEVEVLERYGHVALVLCRPRTGRRHQLRVHLLAAGLPIVGDELYVGRRAPRLPDGAPPVKRQLLHAAGLVFDHPVTGEEFGFEAPAPPDLQGLVDWFEE